MKKVALIVGGSIGGEIVPPVLELLQAAGGEIDWDRVDVPPVEGGEVPAGLLDEAVAAVRRCGVGLKTKLIGPKVSQMSVSELELSGPSSPNVLLRVELDLFAVVRPIRTLPGLQTRYPELDVLLVRESTEDIYKGIEHEIVPGVVQSLKIVTRKACHRVAGYAFELAHRLGREHLTFIHKGNIMKQSDGLFMETVREVAQAHPKIGYREMIVDAACMQLVLDPYQFDVILTGNLYGDILSSLGAGLAGGISASHGINVGDEVRVYEAIHGDAAHLEGRGQANPLPLISPAVALLRYLGQEDVAEHVQAAVARVLEAGSVLTADLGGTAGTEEMCAAIAEELARMTHEGS